MDWEDLPTSKRKAEIELECDGAEAVVDLTNEPDSSPISKTVSSGSSASSTAFGNLHFGASSLSTSTTPFAFAAKPGSVASTAAMFGSPRAQPAFASGTATTNTALGGESQGPNRPIIGLPKSKRKNKGGAKQTPFPASGDSRPVTPVKASTNPPEDTSASIQKRSSDKEAEHEELTNQALSALAALGYHVTAADLGKLNPPDVYESELELMAEVRAYFQIAYKVRSSLRCLG